MIDLSASIGKPATAINRRACVIIVEVEYESQQHVIGGMVTAVHNVLEISPDPESLGIGEMKLNRHLLHGMFHQSRRRGCRFAR